MMVALHKQHNILDFPEPAEMQGRTKSNEWFTPSPYIEAARRVMGGEIDLDPASCALANRTVKAKRYYTKEDDGLSKEWLARSLWLNPPYGKLANKSMLEMWVRRLIQCYQQGNISEAILLATTNIEAPWFALLWDYPICFVDHEIRFMHPSGVRKCHLFGSTLVYFGPNESAFIEHFSQFGRIARAIDTPKPSPVNLTLWNGGEV